MSTQYEYTKRPNQRLFPCEDGEGPFSDEEPDDMVARFGVELRMEPNATFRLVFYDSNNHEWDREQLIARIDPTMAATLYRLSRIVGQNYVGELEERIQVMKDAEKDARKYSGKTKRTKCD